MHQIALLELKKKSWILSYEDLFGKYNTLITTFLFPNVSKLRIWKSFIKLGLEDNGSLSAVL